MKKILFALFFIFVFIATIGAQSEIDSLITRGLNLSYHTKFDEAEKVFLEALKISPENKEVFYRITQIHTWEFLGSNDSKDYDSFIRWYNVARTKAEQFLDKKPDDFQTAYMLGNLYMFKVMVEYTNHSYLRAFSAIKSASNYFNKTLELNSRFYDAYRGLGEIHYFLDFIPGLLKWAISIAGLEANKAKGLKELRIAYQKGRVDKIESAVSLSEVYADYLAEYDSTKSLLQGLTGQYPNNSMFNYRMAIILIKSRDLKEANKYLDLVLKENNPHLVVLNNFSLFLKGDIFFKMNDFNNSIKYNQMFLSATKGKDYTGIANYRLGLSYYIIGKYEKAKQCFEDALNGNQDIYEDSFAKSRCEEFLRKGISNEEITLVQMRNNLDAGKYKNIISTLQPIIFQFKDTNEKAKGLVFIAESELQLGKYFEGIQSAKQSELLNSENESWIKPYSWYLIAFGNYKTRNFTAAVKYLSKVVDTDVYEKDNVFYGLVNNLKRKTNME